MNVIDVTLMAWPLLLLTLPVEGNRLGDEGMELSMDFQPVYQHHDLLIELGRVEMAMEYLEERSENERQTLRPRLISRLNRLRDELARLAV